MDYERLREDLKNYFGTAMANGNPMAMMELSQVENATEDELILMAIFNSFDLDEYVVKKM